MAMNDTTLNVKLDELMDKKPSARPFVCKGRPEACDVLIVGTNPATTMKKPFKCFWSAKHGFDKKAWLKSYEEQRNGKWSRTRHVIEGVLEAAPGVGFLETNVYATATASEADILPEHRDSKFFKLLVDTVRPKIIIAHGRKAHRGVAAVLSCDGELVPSLDPEPVKTNEGTVVLAVPHFSRGWSYKQPGGGRAAEFGQRVASLVARATQ